MQSLKKFGCLLVLAALLAPATGCSVVESENIKTAGIWAHFVVEHFPNDDVIAYAALRVGDGLGTIVELTGGDYMECNGIEMTEFVEEVTNYHWSRAEVPEDASGVYDVDFVRPDETVMTAVAMNDLPTIMSPLPGASVGPGDQITVEWTTLDPGDQVNVFVTGDCIVDISEFDQQDDGTFTLPELQDLDPQNPASCELQLELRRITQDDVSTAFKGGYTEAKRIDQIDLSYEQ